MLNYVNQLTPYLVNMVNFDNTVKVPEPLVLASSLETSSRQQMYMEAATQPHVSSLAIPVYFVLHKV